MYEVMIKQADKVFLLNLLAKRAIGDVQASDLVGRFHSRSACHSNSLFANFAEAELEVLIEILGDIFVSSGLQQTYDPNGLGHRIESYIDTFTEPMLK